MDSITGKLTREGVRIGIKAVVEKWTEDHAREEIRRELDKMPMGDTPGDSSSIPVVVMASKKEVRSGVIPAGAPILVEGEAHPWPTTGETVGVVKEDLLNQIDQLSFDLMRGGRIAGKSCDCFLKHGRNIEALSKELASIKYDPTYTGLTDWVESHRGEFTPEAIEGHEVEYYRALIPELRTFRKKIEGTMA